MAAQHYLFSVPFQEYLSLIAKKLMSDTSFIHYNFVVLYVLLCYSTPSAYTNHIQN